MKVIGTVVHSVSGAGIGGVKITALRNQTPQKISYTFPDGYFEIDFSILQGPDHLLLEGIGYKTKQVAVDQSSFLVVNMGTITFEPLPVGSPGGANPGEPPIVDEPGPAAENKTGLLIVAAAAAILLFGKKIFG